MVNLLRRQVQFEPLVYGKRNWHRTSGPKAEIASRPNQFGVGSYSELSFVRNSTADTHCAVKRSDKMGTASEHPAVLTIAGSDSGGGAGIQVGKIESFRPIDLLMMSTGRSKSIHRLWMLWRVGDNCSDCTEHHRGAGCSPYTTGLPRTPGPQNARALQTGPGW